MTQIRRRIGDYAQSKFLNSGDVLGQEGPATITGVSEREVQDQRAPGGKRLALMIEFDRWPDKGYDCNATNVRVLEDMLGDDTGPDDLRGVRVFVTTQETNFGRGILFQAPQDSMHDASAAARQRIAGARAAESAAADSRYAQHPLPALALAHSHSELQNCGTETCDVARARSLGHDVAESWPAPAAPEPAPFVPMHQPTTGTGPQAQRAAPASHAAQRADAHGASDAPPGEYHEDDPGSIAPAPAADDIPF